MSRGEARGLYTLARVREILGSYLSMPPGLEAATYDRLLDREAGFCRRVRLDIAGIGTVLALRGKYGVPRKKLDDPMKYIDLGYYDAAVGD